MASGIFAFYTATEADSIVTHSTSGVVDGIDIKLDALQNETEAQNISRFRSSILKPLGCDTNDIGATYHLDSANNLFEVRIRASNNTLFDMSKMVCLGKVVLYIHDQIKNGDLTVLEKLSEGYKIYTPRIHPIVDFVQDDGNGNPTLNYVADSSTLNEDLNMHKNIFEAYCRNVLGFQPSTTSYSYAISSPNFVVTVKTNNSSFVQTQFLKIAASTSGINGTMPEYGPLASWYDAMVGGLKGLTTV